MSILMERREGIRRKDGGFFEERKEEKRCWTVHSAVSPCVCRPKIQRQRRHATNWRRPMRVERATHVPASLQLTTQNPLFSSAKQAWPIYLIESMLRNANGSHSTTLTPPSPPPHPR